VYGQTSFLFTGDAGIKAEKYYANYFRKFLDSDVLKVGHHGSKTSSGELFVELVKPQMAVISAGVGNKFKHPSKEVIARFQASQTEILRTDLSGAILLQSDGFNIKNINWEKLESGFIF
jgi:beta-lactamase superfamily II metal-dependent hydrolase